MSNNRRTSRRRRITLGLGATGGGLLAAAFMPMGIALADTTGTAVDTAVAAAGNLPTDYEISPDPFSDLAGASANTTTAALDTQFNDLNPIYAAQFDYAIDNNAPFTFDGISGTVPTGYTAPAGGDPFEDVAGVSSGNALQYDYALNTLLGGSADATTLDNVYDGTPVAGTPGEPTTADPFLDALQATTTGTPTDAQIADANYADYLLYAQNPDYATSLDHAIETAITNGTLTPDTAVPTDVDGFEDAFANAGASSAVATAEGATFAAGLPDVSAAIDPTVDTLGVPVDNDPGVDFVQMFDPNAFTAAGLPNDFFGTLAVDYDQFVNLFGLGSTLDVWVDDLATFFTSIGL